MSRRRRRFFLSPLAALVLTLAPHTSVAQEIGPGADLRRADLSGLDLSGVDLTGAKLQRANLRGTRLIDAVLVGARLNRADMTGADVQGADLTDADARRARFDDADLSRVSASGARMQRASFQRARLDSTNLDGAFLQRANLTAAHAPGVDLTDASLQRAVFRFASLVGASMVNANAKRADLSGADLRGADLSGADFKRASQGGVIFTSSDVPLLPDQVSFDARVQSDLGQSAAGLAEVCATSPFSYGLYSGGLLDPLVLGGFAAEADALFGPVYTAGPILVQDEAIVSPDSVLRSGFPGPGDPVIVTSPNAVGAQLFQQQLPAPERPDPAAFFGSNVVQVRPEDYSATSGRFEGDPSDPRAIFVWNPQRKDSESATTDRNDFFLDDVFVGTTEGGPSFGQIAGQDQEPFYDDNQTFHVSVNPDGNDKVYVIEGNFWLHDSAPITFKLLGDGQGTRATFVAQGNIYISDNLAYENLEKDAVAFVALKQPEDFPDEFGVPPGNEAAEGSGNIFFGDASAESPVRFSGFMYAENDLVVTSFSNDIFVYGNMTAGSSLHLNRDAFDRKSLVIDYDARLELGEVRLPGIPLDAPDPTEFVFPDSWKLTGIEFNPGPPNQPCAPPSR